MTEADTSAEVDDADREELAAALFLVERAHERSIDLDSLIDVLTDAVIEAGWRPAREVAGTPAEPSSYRLRSETWDGDSCGGCGRAPVEHCPSCRRCGANEHDVDWLVTLAEERES